MIKDPLEGANIINIKVACKIEDTSGNIVTYQEIPCHESRGVQVINVSDLSCSHHMIMWKSRCNYVIVAKKKKYKYKIHVWTKEPCVEFQKARNSKIHM